ncbi:MAG: aspartyl protease family protein [Elusimicrobiales bacterium]|nr:aspartyl protease family protein [Elusimicrobiales bacterium]
MKKIAIFILTLTTPLACAFSQDTVPLGKYGRTLKQLNVLIGGATYPFLLDTGGGETVITPELAAKNCKKIYGKTVGFRMHGEAASYQKCDGIDLKIGNTKLHHPSVGVFDIMSLLPSVAPKIYGMIALKSFQDKVITLDLPASELTIETKKSAKKKRKQMTLLDSRFPTGMSGNELDILLGIRRNDALYWFLFDTGNGHHPLISPQTAYDWGLQQDPVSSGTTHQTEISFGPRAETVNFDSDEIIYDGVLNYDLISKRAYLIDFVKKQVWMN